MLLSFLFLLRPEVLRLVGVYYSLIIFIMYLNIILDFCVPVNSDNLPPFISVLNFTNSSFNYPLDYLPSTITKIIFGSVFNSPITKLPNSLTHLKFGYGFNHPISCLPLSLTHLEFGKSFNSSPYPLPDKLTHLTLGEDFNLPLNYLPNSLKTLIFDSESDFNHPLSLPPKLTQLEFYRFCRFGQKLVDIPQTLTHFVFDVINYSHPIKLDHCSHLTHLTVVIASENSDVNLILPNHTITHLNCSLKIQYQEYLLPSLKSLELGYGTLNSFPSLPLLTSLSLDSIELNFSFKNLLPSLTSLKIDASYRLSIDYQLPSSLTYLYIYDFTGSVDHLPPNLKKLELCNNFSMPVDHLPSSLTSLCLGNAFNHPIENLPPSLKRLKIGNSFNKPIDNLPLTLQHLSLGNNFNYPLTHLPTSLKKLYLKHKFNQPLNILPPSLTSIELGKSCEQEICHLPNLTSLYCSGKITFMNPFLPASLQKLVLSLDKLPKIYLPPKLKLVLIGKDGINFNAKLMKCSKHERLVFSKHNRAFL